MGAKAAIPWCDATWNPVVGCRHISPGCDHCYAERMAMRFCGPDQIYEWIALNEPPGWTGEVQLLLNHLDNPLRWKEPKRIFVCSMGDLFAASSWMVSRINKVMWDAQRHVFFLLTKRPFNARKMVEEGDLVCGQHMWLGVSVEDQERADERIPTLLATPASHRWVSVEPMIGPVDLRPWLVPGGLEWVVCGCESGPGKRHMALEWVQSLRDQCVHAGVPFFLKQMPFGYSVRKMPFLDGRVWDQIPEGQRL